MNLFGPSLPDISPLATWWVRSTARLQTITFDGGASLPV